MLETISPPFTSVTERKVVTHKTLLLEGGPYHMHHPRVALDEDGEPPLWLHMVDPIGAPHNLLTLAEFQDVNIHVYERRTRQDPATGLQVRYYRHWTPTDGPNLSE